MSGTWRDLGAPRVYDPSVSARRLRLEGLPLASFRRRAVALTLDFAMAGALFLFLAYGSLVLLKKIGGPEGEGWEWKVIQHVTESTVKNGETNYVLRLGFFSNLVSVVWLVLYFGLSLYWGKGRTLGKRWLGIRVLSLDHETISLWHSTERALAYGASALEAGFGFFQYFLDRNRRTVHDRIAETIVVREERVSRGSSAAPARAPATSASRSSRRAAGR